MSSLQGTCSRVRGGTPGIRFRGEGSSRRTDAGPISTPNGVGSDAFFSSRAPRGACAESKALDLGQDFWGNIALGLLAHRGYAPVVFAMVSSCQVRGLAASPRVAASEPGSLNSTRRVIRRAES